jgi:acyl-CoA thioesterase-1
MKHILIHRFLITLLLLGSTLLINLPLSAQDDNPALMVFGDSLSAAYRIPEEQGWVSLLAQKVQEKDIGFRIINASVSGETTDGGLARLPAALATHSPALVILELGGNDGLRGIPVANIRQNLIAMVRLCQEAGAQVILAGIQIPPNYGPRYTEPFAAQFQEIAEEMRLPLIPFLIDGIPQNPELMQDDGLHPRAEAQGIIVDNVWPVIEPLLRAGQAQS